MLPYVGQTVGDAARNVQDLSAPGTKHETHGLVVRRRILSGIEQTNQKAIGGHYKPDIFLVVVQVESFDCSWEHLRISTLADLEVGQDLQIALLVQSNQLCQRTAVIDEQIQI